jgi:TrmH family RNA methyltransferase
MINKSTIKYIQSLQHKKFRDEHGAFIAEGPKVVLELLQYNIFECEFIYCNVSGLNSLPEKIKNQHADKIIEVADFELEKISALSTANNLLGVFKKKSAINSININNKITLFLDDIQDPGNLGTIIRTADWFGLETIFCSNATADCYNPKVVQSTMASLGRLNIFYGSLVEELQKHKNIQKYAAVLAGKNLESFGKIKEGILVIGNESKGISAAVMEFVDEKITIPKMGKAESLNAAVATGIILYSITN